MSFFKRHLLFTVLLGVILAGTLVLGWFMYSSWSEAKKARDEVQQKQGELQRFLTLPVYPNRDNAERVRKELADTKVALETMFRLLQSTDQTSGAFPEPPTSRTEAYFSLTRFIEDYRAKAEEVGLAIGADERFGFSQFANQGPEQTNIPKVFRQRYLAEIILNSPFESSASQLVAFQREVVVAAAPVDPNAPQGVAPVASQGGGNDTFAIAPQISARKEGFIDTVAFRVQFTGYTNSLRTFLNKLANSPFPIVVRAVEVMPQGGDNSQQRQAEAPRPASPFGGRPTSPFGSSAEDLAQEVPADEKPIQIISQNLSNFTVTLEYIELVPEPAAETPNP